ncbi:NADAR family protein [Saccharibacillus sp. CPCC 101409]|uniref:NADAR family protein n=1 Tax=Saccharibacillus sp. CPCC 101409 TaxID=3058041 RepID=UPI002671EDB7|nr:NADAR family protein [Saccharibacillus sp. CPCC 101409]MDO3409923.1 NADAR family protein [Saccharibacillus sp. CPCC 101409]
MIYNLAALRKAYNGGQRLKYLFFWGHTPKTPGRVDASCLSQWWPSGFAVDGTRYSCAEQYMMAEKARLFGDEEARTKILQAKHPKQMKAFGREVRNFDGNVWNREAYGIVKQGGLEKFRQNRELWDFLKKTENRILVEASPQDRIWGIGMDKNDPDIEKPVKWKGTNLLGFALSEARDELIEEGH